MTTLPKTSRLLSLDHDHFAKDLALASLGGWFCLQFESGQPRDCKDTCFLHFSSGDCGKLVEDLCALSFLQLSCCGQCFGNRTFAHCGGGLLHWSHGTDLIN